MRSKSEKLMNEIIDYIDECYFDYNYTPTMQEIADNVGLNKSNVCRYLQEMSKKGLVDMSDSRCAIKTVRIKKMLGDFRRVPIVGEIACGTPMFAEENIESYLTVSGSFLGPGSYFALRARGDSMINADIYEGDLVIVRQQNTAEQGQIVVALIDDSTTLKRFYRDDAHHKVRLHPENDEMKDMYFDDINIQGVVKKVVKDVG